MASPFGNFIEALGALEYLRQQQEQRTSQAGLQAMQLLSKQGTFNPVPKEQVGIAGNLLGLLPQNQYKVGGNVLQFQPYPEVDIPGYGKLRLPPEDAAKMAMQRNDDKFFAERLAGIMGAGTEARFPEMDMPPMPQPQGSPTVPQSPMGIPPQPSVTPQARPAKPSLGNISRWQPLIEQTATSMGVPPNLVKAVVAGGEMSTGDPRAVSPKGAMGLMQLMPATVERYGVQDPFDPEQNIRGGVAFLGDLWKKYQGNVPLVLAAYNAGEGAVAKAGNKIPPFPETQAYVPRATQTLQALGGLGGSSQMVAGTGAAPRPETAPYNQRLLTQVGTINQQIAGIEKQMQLLGTRGSKSKDLLDIAQGKLNRLEQRRDALEGQLDEPTRARAKELATYDIRLQETRDKAKIDLESGITKEKVLGPIRTQQEINKEAALGPIRTQEEINKAMQLSQVYADRARMELEQTVGLKERLAKASREEQPVGKEITDKVDALLGVRDSMNVIQDVLSRRGTDTNFMTGMKQAATTFTGPIEGFVQTYFKQPFNSEDADENDFVTALRNLQSQEIRSAAGLAQTGTEVDRQVGTFIGRLPTISNPPEVFASRMKFLDRTIDRQLGGMARNLQGRAYGQWIQEYVKERGESDQPLMTPRPQKNAPVPTGNAPKAPPKVLGIERVQ